MKFLFVFECLAIIAAIMFSPMAMAHPHHDCPKDHQNCGQDHTHPGEQPK